MISSSDASAATLADAERPESAGSCRMTPAPRHHPGALDPSRAAYVAATRTGEPFPRFGATSASDRIEYWRGNAAHERDFTAALGIAAARPPALALKRPRGTSPLLRSRCVRPRARARPSGSAVAPPRSNSAPGAPPGFTFISCGMSPISSKTRPPCATQLADRRPWRRYAPFS